MNEAVKEKIKENAEILSECFGHAAKLGKFGEEAVSWAKALFDSIVPIAPAEGYGTEETPAAREGPVCYHCNASNQNGVVIPSGSSSFSIILCRKCIRDLAVRLRIIDDE